MEKEKKGVRLDHISKIYKDPKTGKDFYAVKDTCLEIRPGSFVTLLGPSGCGKTTTLRMIAGFESPDEGEIYLGNEAINALPPNKRDTAMVFQSYALLPHYNVFDNVAYPLRIKKMDKDAIQKKYKAAVDELFNTLRGSERDRSMGRFREKVSSFKASGDRRLRSERERLYNKVRQLEQEIGLLENNIGFFAKSKNAEALVADVRAKIERAREEMASTIEKVKLIDKQDQDENNNA